MTSAFLIGSITTAYCVLVYYMARLSGQTDAEDIERRIRAGDRRELDHKALWTWRAIGIVGLCLMACLITQSWWALTLLLCGYGIMASVHRWTLNKARGLDWGYMDDLSAGGNKYDEFWWKLWMRFASDDELDLIIQTSKRLIIPVRISHKVARLAYGTEILSFLTGLSLYLIKS